MSQPMFVKAWNGKWHLLDRTIGTEPEVPAAPGQVAKVARPIVVTKCGLQAFARRFSGETMTVHRSKMKCANCWAMIRIKRPSSETQAVESTTPPSPFPVPPMPVSPVEITPDARETMRDLESALTSQSQSTGEGQTEQRVLEFYVSDVWDQLTNVKSFVPDGEPWLRDGILNVPIVVELVEETDAAGA